MFILAESKGMVQELVEVFTSGGWIMIMLGSVAFILYATAFAAFSAFCLRESRKPNRS